jgi:putative glycerol kinase 5
VVVRPHTVTWHYRYRCAPLTAERRRWNNSVLMRVVNTVGGIAHRVSGSGRHQAMREFKFDTVHVSVRLRWVLDHVPNAAALIESGDLLFGTMDTWLLWQLTGGAVHATDYSSVSTTGLYDFYVLDWSWFVLKILGLPRSILPEIRDTSGDFGQTEASLFGAPIPIRALVADQQSAMFGHGCFRPGDAKISLGTGTFLNINTGSTVHTPAEYTLYPVIAWKIGSELTYMAEVNASCTGTLVDWGVQAGLLPSAAAADGIASSVPNSNGVVCVNAFYGLGSPYHDASARGAFLGLSSGTTTAHMVRAMLESIAFRFMDLFSVLQEEFDTLPADIRVDGGVARSEFVLQAMSTLSGARMHRTRQTEMTALGAAFLAGLAAGVWSSRQDLSERIAYDPPTQPGDPAPLQPALALWRTAVGRVCKWPHSAN